MRGSSRGSAAAVEEAFAAKLDAGGHADTV